METRNHLVEAIKASSEKTRYKNMYELLQLRKASGRIKKVIWVLKKVRISAEPEGGWFQAREHKRG